MIWNRNKHKPVDASTEDPKPERKDEYVPFVGQWYRLYICHCGYKIEDKPGHGHVCPDCGHVDSLDGVVGRWVGDVLKPGSPSIISYFFMSITVRPDRDMNRRNVKFERWTPDHCGVKVD